MNRSHTIVVLGFILASIGNGVVATQTKQESEQLQSLQPLVAAPDHHRLRFENEYVRVLEIIVPPGDIVPHHLHDLPSVFITLSSAQLRFRDADGVVTLETFRADIPPETGGLVGWLDPGAEPGSVENIDEVEFRGFRIEFKSHSGK